MTSYPIALPSAPNFRTSKFGPDAAVAVSESPFTFEQQVYVHPGQRWKANLTLPSMKRVTADYWCAAITSLNGRQGTFLLGDPDAKLPRGAATGVPVVNGANQSGNTLATRGWTVNTTGILLTGDYFQLGLGGTARLYKVLSDVSSDGSGLATFSIWPNIRTATLPGDGDSLFTTGAKTQFRMDSGFMWDADQVSTYGINFSCTESL